MEGGRILPLLGIPAEKERQDGEGCQIRKKKLQDTQLNSISDKQWIIFLVCLMKYLGNSYTKNIQCFSETWTSLVFCILSGNRKYGKEVIEDGGREEIGRLINIPYPDPRPKEDYRVFASSMTPGQILKLLMSFLL